MNASKLVHFSKRALQTLAVLLLLVLAFQKYSEYTARVAYDSSPQGKARLASEIDNREAKQRANIKTASNIEAVRLANIKAIAYRRSKQLTNTVVQIEAETLSDNTESETEIIADKTDAKMLACSNQRMQEYAYGKQSLKMSLKNPGSFEQHGLAIEYASSYDIIYSSTNIYGGQVRSSFSIPVTNCTYEKTNN